MRAAAALALAAVLCAQDPSGAPADYARLAQLFELGLDAELVATGLPLVSAGGALAGDGQAAALVARALFAVGREDEALRMLDETRAGDAAGRAALVLMRARLHLQRDQLEQALALLVAEPGKWEPRFPGAPDNLILLGRALARSGRRGAAEPVLERFVREAPLHPEGPAAWHMLFDCAVARGDVARAEACRAEKERLQRWHDLLRARRLQVRRDPAARLPRLGLALLWIDAGELEEARRALDELLALHPGDVEAWLHLGEVHRKRGDLAEAQRAYARALELDPAEHRARYSLALLHRQAGRTQDARRELETLLAGEAASDPRFLGAHLALARILAAAGEAQAARARYEVYVAGGGKEAL